MKIIPVLKCRNMPASISFYTQILGFRSRDESATPAQPVVDLIDGEAVIQLSVLDGDGVFGSAVNIDVDDVDSLFEAFVQRGLDRSKKPESPVHQHPIDQTWGLREFYVNDPDGNTLRYRQPCA